MDSDEVSLVSQWLTVWLNRLAMHGDSFFIPGTWNSILVTLNSILGYSDFDSRDAHYDSGESEFDSNV